MTETMQTDHSPMLGALAKALASAQGKIQGAKKTAANPHLRSRYATLADIWDACREPLSVNGLAVVQTTEPHGREGVCVVTTLMHESGEWIRSRYFLPVTKPDAHGFGSATTYARRYSLAAMVGVAPDEDDDSHAAVQAPKAGFDLPGPTKAESDPVEKELTALYTASATADDVAKADATAAKYSQAKKLTPAARARLLPLRAEAVDRVVSSS